MEYSPWLIGIRHSEEELVEVLQTLNSIPAKKIGIELHKYFLHDPIFTQYDANIRVFWETIVHTLKRKGKEIIFLVPEKLRMELDKEMAKAKSPIELIGNKRLAKLAKISLTREMITTAKREKPDIIIVGAGHVGVMRKDLKVRKDRFRIISQEQNKRRISEMVLNQVRGYRRYEAWRRKEKARKAAQKPVKRRRK